MDNLTAESLGIFHGFELITSRFIRHIGWKYTLIWELFIERLSENKVIQLYLNKTKI